MVAFARLRTRSLLIKFWPSKIHLINGDSGPSDGLKSKDHSEQNTHFLDAIKDGGIWFS